jgi:hypothetical protein
LTYNKLIELNFRCSSIISQIYGVNFEELVIEEHGLYAGLQQTEGDYETLGEEFSPPQIHGHTNKYNIGDIVDLNCSASPVSPPPLLEWYINGKEVGKEAHELLVNFCYPFCLSGNFQCLAILSL